MMQQQSFLLTGSPRHAPHWSGFGASAGSAGSAELAGRSFPAEQRRAAPATVHCTTTMIPSIHITSALLLASTEELAAVDRRMLRAIGVRQLKMMTSGAQAARLLCGEGDSLLRLQPDAVFCADALADMSGVDFLELLRLHPLTQRLPLLLLTSGNDAEMVRRTAAAGKAAVLGRPYSSVSLRTVLFALLNAPAVTPLPAERQLVAAGAFDAALESYKQAAGGKHLAPEEHFAQGLAHLQQRAWDDALRAFQQAMQEISLRGDAELGMATAWKGKGDERKYREYMARAAETFALAEKWTRARTTYVRLLRDDPAAANPFLAAVERLVREQRFDAAAMALAEGHSITAPAALHSMLAKTFLAADAPEQQVHQLQRALGRTALATMSASLSASVRQSMYAQARLMRERRAAREQEHRAASARHAESPLTLHMPDTGETARHSGMTQRTGKKGIELREIGGEIGREPEPEGTLVSLPELSALPDISARDQGQKKAQHSQRGSLPPMTETRSRPEPRAQRETRGLREREKRSALREPAARLSLRPPVEAFAAPPAEDAAREAEDSFHTDALPPLTESQSRSSLFTSVPVLNEVLSVIKTTWLLARR